MVHHVAFPFSCGILVERTIRHVGRRGPRDHPPTQLFIQDCSDRRPRAPCCPEESERGAAHRHRKEPDEQRQGTNLTRSGLVLFEFSVIEIDFTRISRTQNHHLSYSGFFHMHCYTVPFFFFLCFSRLHAFLGFFSHARYASLDT